MTVNGVQTCALPISLKVEQEKEIIPVVKKPPVKREKKIDKLSFKAGIQFALAQLKEGKTEQEILEYQE